MDHPYEPPPGKSSRASTSGLCGVTSGCLPSNALARYQMRRKVTLLQVVVPSRQGVKEYEKLRHEIERLVGEINGRYTEVGWTPVHYIFRSLPRKELVAYYRTCEIALITPLKDGMNLVAKEYCASSTEGNGVLILSEFAGAAAQFYPHALLVNPMTSKAWPTPSTRRSPWARKSGSPG